MNNVKDQYYFTSPIDALKFTGRSTTDAIKLANAIAKHCDEDCESVTILEDIDYRTRRSFDEKFKRAIISFEFGSVTLRVEEYTPFEKYTEFGNPMLIITKGPNGIKTGSIRVFSDFDLVF